MKLYDLPRKSKIYCNCTDGSRYLIYDHPDGMYSYCVTEKGNIVHLALWMDVTPTGGAYKIGSEESGNLDPQN